MLHLTAKKCLLFLMLALGALPVLAGPMEFQFTYDFVPGDRISGTLFGELQADSDTITVTDFSASWGPVGFINTFPTIFGPSFTPQTASLSGSVIDLRGTGETAFLPGVEVRFAISSVLGLAGVGTADPSFGGTIEEEVFDPGHWSIARIGGTVPAPSTTFMLLLGLLALRVSRQRAN